MNIYICVCICMYDCMYVRVCLHMSICILMHACMHSKLYYVSMYVHMCVCCITNICYYRQTDICVSANNFLRKLLATQVAFVLKKFILTLPRQWRLHEQGGRRGTCPPQFLQSFHRCFFIQIIMSWQPPNFGNLLCPC